MQLKSLQVEAVARRMLDFLWSTIKASILLVVVTLPALLIKDHDSFEFWKVLGYYGIYLMGFAAVMR